MDNVDRDKELNTADSLIFLKPSVLIKYSLNFTIWSSIYTAISYHKLKSLSTQTTPCTVSFCAEECQSTNSF